MNKIRGSIAAKIVAFVMLLICIDISIIGTVSFVYMIDKDFYFSTKVSLRYDYVENLLVDKLYNDVIDYYFLTYDIGTRKDGIDSLRISSYENRFSKENSNLFFTVKDDKGNLLLNNYMEDDYRLKVSEEYIYPVNEKDFMYYDNFDTLEELYDFDPYNKYYYASVTDYEYVTNTEMGTYTCVTYGYECEYETIYFTGYICNNYTAKDAFYWCDTIIDVMYQLRYVIPAATLLIMLLSIFLFAFLMASVGYRKDKDGFYLNFVDKIPVDIFTAIFAALAVGAVHIIDEQLIYGYVTWYAIPYLLIIVACILGYILSMTARFKSGGWWKNSLLLAVFKFVGKLAVLLAKWIVFLVNQIPAYWRNITIFFIATLVETVLMLYVFDAGEYWGALIIWISERILIVPFIIFISIGVNRLKKGVNKISEGELDYQIDEKHMPVGLKGFAKGINKIGNGMSKAVEEQMKSELLKTELITNVSHDIKTPLTSIVNYVNLIKKEDVENENVKQYVDVLDRQAARLKKLIQDLVDASKASTGNIEVDFKEISLNVLLSQTLAEYVDKFEDKGIKVITDYSGAKDEVYADGQLLWRVFDNLLNNIYKYTQDNTRVYINIEQKGSFAKITFRNISKYELNISADELMERFVRGDRSRNTEGSGLGLSITKSLVELQNGRLDLKIDGDLFKAEVWLQLAP